MADDDDRRQCDGGELGEEHVALELVGRGAVHPRRLPQVVGDAAAASVSALAPLHPEVTELADVVTSARAGDVRCRRVVADAGRAIGSALATLCNIVNPARVIVGGTLGDAGELLLEPMRAAVRRGAVRSAAQEVEIVGAGLGADSELMGAVALALKGPEVPV